jgi:hypothetical protein
MYLNNSKKNEPGNSNIHNNTVSNGRIPISHRTDKYIFVYSENEYSSENESTTATCISINESQSNVE